MKLQRKISVILCIVLILAVMIPQPALAINYVSYEGGDGIYRSYKLFVMGGAEPASDTSLRVYWGDFETKGQRYRIKWNAEGSKQWQSVEIDDPEPESYKKAKSYLITGLEPNQKYNIRIYAVLENERGKCYTGAVKTQGYTYLTAPKYEPYSCMSTGEYIESIWNVKERNAVLKIYRSDAKDGQYRLVSTMDGTESANAQYRKYDMGKLVFRDTDVEPSKSYYYKAVSELTLDDGRVIKKESLSPCKLTAKNKAYRDVKFTSKLINQLGTYAKTLTFKVSSDKANYNLSLQKKNMRVYSFYSSDGKPFDRTLTKIQYSFDGKKYTALKSSVTLKTGKTIYLRVTLKNKIWLRKDGRGYLGINTRYLYRASEDSTYVNRLLNLRMGNQVEFYDPDEGDGWEDDWDSTYDGWVSDEPGLSNISTIASEHGQSVILTWYLNMFADSFSIRYGTSEEEAQASRPMELSSGQFAYKIDNLLDGTQYYFIVSMKYKDKDGQMKEIEKTASIKTAVQVDEK